MDWTSMPELARWQGNRLAAHVARPASVGSPSGAAWAKATARSDMTVGTGEICSAGMAMDRMGE